MGEYVEGDLTMISEKDLESLNEVGEYAIDFLLQCLFRSGIIAGYDRDFVRVAVWRHDGSHEVFYLGEM